MNWSDSSADSARLWCIGGTDPSGVAGLAADQATAFDLHTDCGLVVTALTAQNQQQVLEVQPVSAAFLHAQFDSIDAVLPDVIKIGLVPTQTSLQQLAARLTRYKQQKPTLWLLWDPVLAASNGAVLSTLYDPRPLLALVDVLTPNRSELTALCRMLGDDTPRPDSVLAAGAKAIWCKDGHGDHATLLHEQLYLRHAVTFDQWPQACDLTSADANHSNIRQDAAQSAGTHVAGAQPTGALLADHKPHAVMPALTMRQPRHSGQLRGTGCSFATALGCFLLQPMVLPDALLLASAYLQQAFAASSFAVAASNAACAGDGTTASHPSHVPVHSSHQSNTRQRLPRLGMPNLPGCQFDISANPDAVVLGLPGAPLGGSTARGLIDGAATDHGVRPRDGMLRSPAQTQLAPAFNRLEHPIGIYPIVHSVALLQQLVGTGIRTVQLRLKQTEPQLLRDEIQAAIALGRRQQWQLFINDHWQLAAEFGAYGVHLGQSDLASADLSELARCGIRLGLSTHGELELYQAMLLRPSYVALGHVFATPTKQMPSIPQGLTRIRRQAGWCADIALPTVAIGGLDTHHIRAIKACGIDGMALVRAVCDAPSPTHACQQLVRAWEDA